MDSFALELSAYRIGGLENNERSFGPRIEQINPNGVHWVQLDGRYRAQYSVRLCFGPWRLVRAGLLSTDLRVEDVNGYTIGTPRPVLLMNLPCDVPLYSNHIASDPDYGVVSVGLRSPRSHWTPGDLEVNQAAAEAVA